LLFTVCTSLLLLLLGRQAGSSDNLFALKLVRIDRIARHYSVHAWLL
jgi:hypothetical protein